MNNSIYAMTTFLSSQMGAYPIGAGLEMMKELGYDGVHYFYNTPKSWEDVPTLTRRTRELDLEINMIMGNLNPAKGEGDPAYETNRTMLEHYPEGVPLEVSIWELPGGHDLRDPVGDEEAMEALEPWLDMAEKRGVPHVALYPHFNFWMETPADAIRLCEKMNHPLLRIVFTGFHWYYLGFRDIRTTLDEIGDRLSSVNLSGVRQNIDMVAGMTMEPLDGGEMDNFAVLMELHHRGFAGPIGFQGYGIGGDIYGNMRRSIDTYRDMVDRIERHPDWRLASG